MFPYRRVSGFVIRCGLWYGLFIVPWPGLMDAYRWGFRTAGNLLYCRFGAGGSVKFTPLDARNRLQDTRIVARKRIPPTAEGDLDVNSLHTGYRPTAFLAALVLASPVPWRRRLRALVCGLVAVSAFVALRVGLHLLTNFMFTPGLEIYHPPALIKAVIYGAHRILMMAPEFDYVVPAVIWALVTFRRDDWLALFGNGGAVAPLRSNRRA